MQSLEMLILSSGDSKFCFIWCFIFMKRIIFNWLSGDHLGTLGSTLFVEWQELLFFGLVFKVIRLSKVWMDDLLQCAKFGRKFCSRFSLADALIVWLLVCLMALLFVRGSLFPLILGWFKESAPLFRFYFVSLSSLWFVKRSLFHFAFCLASLSCFYFSQGSLFPLACIAGLQLLFDLYTSYIW